MTTEVNPKIEASWLAVMQEEFDKPYFAELKAFLLMEKKKYMIYPPGEFIFAAFNKTPFKKVKAVIIGQDPYHGENQANGLCFSVNYGIRTPPSLINIFKELNSDIGCPIPESGNLEKWANEGVLLLNATLTVRANCAGSHQNKGWEVFTDAVIKTLSDKREKLVFLLWGNYAKAKRSLINSEKHLILEAAHPSPLARSGFAGCKHFSKTNNYLVNNNIAPIAW